MQSVPPCPAPTHWWQMQVSGLLLHWQLWLDAYSVGLFSFFSFYFFWLCYPLRFQNSPQTCLWEGFLLCGNFSSFTTPSPGRASTPKCFVSVFVFYILSNLLSKRISWFLGAWCPPPTFRSCFVEIAQHSNDLLMNFWERNLSPHPIPPPSLDHLLKLSFKKWVQ